jgi:fatty acid desaturase
MYVLSILAYRLATACVVFGVALLFRRRDVIDPTGTRIYETSASYFARIREAAVALLLVCLLLIVFFWAIVHFGPLRPVHEWLR